MYTRNVEICKIQLCPEKIQSLQNYKQAVANYYVV